MNGTPLRKFGRFRVYQPQKALWTVVDTKIDTVVATARVKDASYFAAAKLAEGEPIFTPNEARDHAVLLYPNLYSNLFQYYEHSYLTLGSGIRWLQGGLAPLDVTEATASGRKILRNASKYRPAQYAQELRPIVQSLVPQRAEAAREIRAAYRAGTWPEARGECVLPPMGSDAAHDRPLGVLVTAPPTTANEAWVEDARQAMRVFLTYGEESSVAPGSPPTRSLRVLNHWALQLAERFGGDWFASEKKIQT